MEKKEKRGFWASLFSPKPCKCACGDAYVIPTEDTSEQASASANSNSEGIKEIKVLGPGCAKCKSTYAVVEKVVKDAGMKVRLTKVDAIEEIMRYNIMSTPAIVIDSRVVLKGKVPAESEVKQLLGIQ